MLIGYFLWSENAYRCYILLSVQILSFACYETKAIIIKSPQFVSVAASASASAAAPATTFAPHVKTVWSKHTLDIWDKESKGMEKMKHSTNHYKT